MLAFNRSIIWDLCCVVGNENSSVIYFMLLCFDLCARVFSDLFWICCIVCVRRFCLGHSMIIMADPSMKAHWKECASSTYIRAKLQNRPILYIQFTAVIAGRCTKSVTQIGNGLKK